MTVAGDRPVLSAGQIRHRCREAKWCEGWMDELGRFTRQGASAVARLDVIGEQGGDFEIIARVNAKRLSDWALVLRFMESGHSWNLLRVRGPLGRPHGNRVGDETPFGPPYVHYATEIYQRRGLAVDGHALPVQGLALPGHGPEQGPIWCRRSQPFTTMEEALPWFANRINLRADDPGQKMRFPL